MTAKTGRFTHSKGVAGYAAMGLSTILGEVPIIGTILETIQSADAFYRGLELQRIANITNNQNIMSEVAEELAYQLTTKRKDSKFSTLDHSNIKGFFNRIGFEIESDIRHSDDPISEKIASLFDDTATKAEAQARIDVENIMIEMMKSETWISPLRFHTNKPNAIEAHDHEAALTRMLQVMKIERQDQKQAAPQTAISTRNVTLTLPRQDIPAVEAVSRSELEELREMMKQQQEESKKQQETIKRLEEEGKQREEQLSQQQEKEKRIKKQ